MSKHNDARTRNFSRGIPVLGTRAYMQAIEEIINIPRLLDCSKTVIAANGIKRVMDEIVTQSKVEFNYPSDVDNE